MQKIRNFYLRKVVIMIKKLCIISILISCITTISGFFIQTKSQTLLNVCKDDKCGYINQNNEIVVPFKYHKEDDRAYSFNEGLAGVCVKNKCGYIDETGKIVIPLKYEAIGWFSEGKARVWKGEKVGYVDQENKIIVPFLKVHGAGEFHDGFAEICEEDSVCNFINITGQKISKKNYEDVEDFSNGYAIVEKDSLWGAIDLSGKEVIPPQFFYLGNFTDGHFAVCKGPAFTECGYINSSGKVIIPLKYTDARDHSEGLGLVSAENEGYFFINNNNEPVFKEKYSIARPFSEERAAICTSSDKWGFIDKTGAVVIETKYEGVGDFHDGIAAAVLNGKCGFIDKNGHVKIPFVYDWVGHVD